MGQEKMKHQRQIIDVVIVGAGPIGIELAILLKRADVDYVHLEAKQIGHTISQWPRNTRFFSAPERVALAGYPIQSPDQQSLTGEMYLSYLRTLVEHFELQIQTYEPVTGIQRLDDGSFLITSQPITGPREYECRSLVLAVGNLSTPRKLGIPGEELPNVDHLLVDPHKYFGKRLCVIGGRNSALEATLRCWRAGADVALSYRRDEFEENVVKPHLSREITLLIDKGMIKFYPRTVPVQITVDSIHLQQTDQSDVVKVYPTDFVLFAVGYEMDQSLFHGAGVTVTGDQSIPEYNERTMETNIPNLYLAGTAAGGMESRHELFIITSHKHVEKIAKQLVGHVPGQSGTLQKRRYDTTLSEVQED